MSRTFEFSSKAIRIEKLWMYVCVLTLAAVSGCAVFFSIQEIVEKPWPAIRTTLVGKSLAAAAVCIAVLIAVGRLVRQSKYMRYSARIRLDEDSLRFEDGHGGVTSYELADLSGVAVGSRSFILFFETGSGESVYIPKEVLPEHAEFLDELRRYGERVGLPLGTEKRERLVSRLRLGLAVLMSVGVSGSLCVPTQLLAGALWRGVLSVRQMFIVTGANVAAAIMATVIVFFLMIKTKYGFGGEPSRGEMIVGAAAVWVVFLVAIAISLLGGSAQA